MEGACSCASSQLALHPGLVDGMDSPGLVHHIDPTAGQRGRQVRVNKAPLLLNIHPSVPGV